MLKNITFHIDQDDSKQKQLEENVSPALESTFRRNIKAFDTFVPSLIPVIEKFRNQNKSVICNKLGEINIVDFGLGRVLYGLNPKVEIKRQYELFIRHPLLVDLKLNNELRQGAPEQLGYEKIRNLPAMSKTPDCIVMLGCGLGYQILDILKDYPPKHLIIYEAQPQYLSASMYANQWDDVLKIAHQNDVKLYFQIGKDGRDLIQDIEELSAHFNIANFYCYKHLNTPIYDSVYYDLLNYDWHQITKRGFNFSVQPKNHEYCPEWTPPVDLDECTKLTDRHSLFISNLKSFEKYYPDIYEEYQNYQPKHWLPVKTAAQNSNIISKTLGASWFTESPIEDYSTSYEAFKNAPNQDGLILGYSGEKLLHYHHYKFVKETEKLLTDNTDDTLKLPQNVPAIILFGLGLGHQIELLLANHEVENLFICEPNPDLFFASLHCIDWKKILEKIDRTDSRLYLNIGDDGTNLFRDLISQFYNIGPYILNQTYFYQGYYNAGLNSAIAQLREQLKVTISMGEYFDHAYYGINHTKEGLKRDYPILRKFPSRQLSTECKDTPVFIIGNGPSIDHSIETIKAWQKKAILISCGTALQVFHKHKIIPDYHAEIEQNRTTFDWACNIGDLEYLKKIKLISCNGIHPDTCDLYKNTFITFKEGESSTTSAFKALQDKDFEILKYAFPTVTNFATNVFTSLGFENIYLIGVDLGFFDQKHHHSKSSAYYNEDGTELGNYSEHYNTSIVVQGNFRPQVFTKPEFKMSKQILENTIENAPKEINFYNCSDGALIKGAAPLILDNIISTADFKDKAIKEIEHKAFRHHKNKDVIASYENSFKSDLLFEELKEYKKLISLPIETNQDIDILLKKQRQFLNNSYIRQQTFFFYYFYGTCNYVSAVLAKTVDFTKLDGKASQTSLKAVESWQNNFTNIQKLLSRKVSTLDHSFINILTREKLVLQQKLKGKSLLIVHDGQDSFYQSCLYTLRNYFKIDFYKVEEASNTQVTDKTKADIVIYFGEQPIKCYGNINTVLAFKCSEKVALSITNSNPKLCVVPFFKHIKNYRDETLLSNMFMADMSLFAAIETRPNSLIIPKYHSVSTLKKPALFDDLLENSELTIYEFYYYFLVTTDIKSSITRAGTRGKLCNKIIPFGERTILLYTEKEFHKLLERQLECAPKLSYDKYFEGFV